MCRVTAELYVPTFYAQDFRARLLVCSRKFASEELCVPWRRQQSWQRKSRSDLRNNATAQQAKMSAAVEEDWETAVGTLSIVSVSPMKR